ncbi:hypothetical protein CYLTODRAFT_426321 [Cylindrobasidium torrendii FP15055 ss-10]|uniref:Aip3p/Bud6 N-terminal domain-containing protein n=1 Tax=Cylindrobasidium torrendii FP15055 ss-10 TaxID=1314674 RepID=A0A0D7AXU8_9AGAR|nr:hypothetical protein CYLTODRAFT_426321 [Cylindrobasidium torrendii FP15055 ss-10]
MNPYRQNPTPAPPYSHGYQQPRHTSSQHPHSYSPRSHVSNYDAPPAFGLTPSRTSSSSSMTNMAFNLNTQEVSNNVHSLLQSTKDLQDTLHRWSRGQADEGEVSDIYVRIGTQFNATVQAFAVCGIDLSDILSVPNELRGVLEQCLAEDPSPAVIGVFMPALKRVLYKLLRGLRARQDAWRTISGAIATPTT